MGSIGNINEPDRRINVLVTGFGPFQERFPVNPSWEITRSLPKTLPIIKPDGRTIQIFTYDTPIRVSYEEVRQLVPALHESFLGTVDLILHIGMSSGRDFYTAEKFAHRDGYDKNKDLDGLTLSTDHCLAYFGDCPSVMTTSLNCDRIVDRWQANVTSLANKLPGFKADCRLSEDAGHYLCDYIYFNSLSCCGRRRGVLDGGNVESRPVLFLHVPAESDTATLERGRHVTMALIEAMVDDWCASRSSHAQVSLVA